MLFRSVGSTKKHHIQTRVVSATNKNLEKMIEDGLFRKDLYYRIGVIKINVPSLNERRNDIILLAGYFLDEFSEKFDKTFTGISSQAQEALMNHNWTGNVRELKNLVERGVLIGKGPELGLRDVGLEDSIQTQNKPNNKTMFPPIPPEGIDILKVQQSVEKYYIDEAYRIAKGNESRAARLLNINHHTFRYRRKKLLEE